MQIRHEILTQPNYTPEVKCIYNKLLRLILAKYYASILRVFRVNFIFL